MKESIAVLSDGTCETAELYIRAVLAQFQSSDIHLVRIPKIRTPENLKASLDQLHSTRLVAYTFASPKLRSLLHEEMKARKMTGLDILSPGVNRFSEVFKVSPSEASGALHTTQSLDYFSRMDAIEFTVKHDDGMKLNDLKEADVILTGVSRTSKTPTSMYLAHKGYRVANVPLVYGIEPPTELINLDVKKVPVFLLTTEPRFLERIRRSRFQRLGTAPNQKDTYINVDKIDEELRSATLLARRYQWHVIDVTGKAIEETASEILLLVSLNV